MLGVGPIGTIENRVGHADPERLLAPGLARSQRVQRDSRNDRGQPPSQVLDAIGVGAAEPQPGFLNGVVGLAHRAEHPVGHRSQMAAVLLEPLRQPFVLDHVTFLRRRVS